MSRHAEAAGRRVFGRCLAEHLADTGEQVPRVVTLCAAIVEERGIVDGIYRLSGITSNIQVTKPPNPNLQTFKPSHSPLRRSEERLTRRACPTCCPASW